MPKSKLKLFLVLAALCAICAGCATGRDLTSENYIPEWENKLINVPSPSETSGGRWVTRGAGKTADLVGQTLLIPFALAGNAALNAYYIPTWPVRAAARGDKRLIVWQPIFGVGSTAGSDFYSKEWNKDLV